MNNDALSQILTAIKMRGAVYFHTRFSAPFSIRVPPYQNVARFHMAMVGACWIRVDGAPDPIYLANGDLVVVPHGSSHILSDTSDGPALELDEVIKISGYNGKGAFVYGGGEETDMCQLFCGHFEFDSDAFHPMLSSLPKLIHIPRSEDVNSAWLKSIIDFVSSEVRSSQAGADAIVYRLTEIIFIKAIRSFVDRAGEASGCLAAILDPHLSQALSAVHLDPSRSWTVESMAKEAGLSRTVFAERFTHLIGMAPLTYVTQWRMQAAKRQLAETRTALIEIAEAAGYQSAPAFARAFKRYFGFTPGSLRKVDGLSDQADVLH